MLISAIKQSDSVVHAHPDTHTHTHICARSDRQGQGSLAWCSPWGRKESETTELLNNNHLWSHLTACGILVLQPDCEPVPLALEVQRVLTTGSHASLIYLHHCFCLFICLFGFELFFIFWNYGVLDSSCILNFSGPWISHVSEDPWFLLIGEWY